MGTLSNEAGANLIMIVILAIAIIGALYFFIQDKKQNTLKEN